MSRKGRFERWKIGGRTRFAEEPLRRAYRIARMHGMIAGITDADLEGCALEFVEQLSSREMTARPGVAAEHWKWSDPWLHASARNHAILFGSNLAARERHSSTDPAQADALVESIPADLEKRLDHDLTLSAVLTAIEELEPDATEMFWRHQMEDETIADLAASFGRTTGAIKESLRRSRIKLREILARRNIVEAEINRMLG